MGQKTPKVTTVVEKWLLKNTTYLQETEYKTHLLGCILNQNPF